MKWVEDDAVLITGGGSGLGRALVSRFLAEGAHVAVLEASSAKASRLRDEVPQVEVVVGDVRSMQDNQAAVRAAVARYGKLDVFIGNAGILDQFLALLDMPIDRLSEAFDEVFGINVKGFILGARAAAPELLKTRGSMVFTASGASFVPGGGGVFYTASKHAVVGVVRELAYQLAPAIRVNAVAPGPMRTDMRGSAALGANERTQLDAAGWAGILKSFPLQHIEPEAYTGIYVALASREGTMTTTGAVIDAADGLCARGHFATCGFAGARQSNDDPVTGDARWP